MISIPLDKMSLAEKLEAMEALWADLSRTPTDVPVPQWHRDVLKAMRQPYEKVCRASGIPFQQLADFMAGGQLASDALDCLAAAALPARAWRSFAKTGVSPDQCA